MLRPSIRARLPTEKSPPDLPVRLTKMPGAYASLKKKSLSRVLLRQQSYKIEDNQSIKLLSPFLHRVGRTGAEMLASITVLTRRHPGA